MISSLYLHIPFCTRICSYCDFPKVFHQKEPEEKYIPELIREIDSYHIPANSLKTIYIGGGTPSVLSTPLLEKLLSYLSHYFSTMKEFTIEANPESRTEEKAAIRSRYGVNRVSLGVESTNPTTLSYLGRNHTLEQALAAVSNLKKHNIDNINLDFIYGVSGESLTDLKEDIQFALNQNVKHLSFYSLQIEQGTVLHNQKTIPVSDDIYRMQYDFLVSELEKNGFHRYEVSNFAKPGYESKHNLTYWHDQQYYACGLGASGYIGNLRYTNTKSLTNYLLGKRIFQKDIITKEDEEREFLRLGLRLRDGFSLSEYQERFHVSFLEKYGQKIDENKECFEIEGDCFRINTDYLYVMDSLLFSLF